MNTGKYALNGNQFDIGGCRYVFKKRKKATVNKPIEYLIQLTPSFKYISSLFPAGEEGLYTFDFQSQMYILKKEVEHVIITEGE
ncbi:MAG TPA: hypothetical protein P5150_06195 [Candidatus Ratteibacteria bacterium]|nr:hypothetical protein [Candidatus Ratteibacteria bacterium]